MLTAYINNAEMRTGTHFRTCVNVFFDVRSLRSTLRSRTTMTTDKRLARAYLSEISSFKTILMSAESYNVLEGRVDKIRALGEEYLEAFIFFDRGWRRLVVGHIAILFGMSFQRQSQYTYCMNSPNSMQCSPRLSVDHLYNGKCSPFGIRSSRHTCSLILGWLRLTYSICQVSKFISSTKIRTSGSNILILIEGHSGGAWWKRILQNILDGWVWS